MKMSSFFVFDTNSLISAALRQKSTNRTALDKAIDLGSLAFSNRTFDELIEVLFRKKLDKYFANNNERWLILNKIKINSSLFFPDISLKASCDPKDDKFLELAVSANASCIITGDKDLLILHPFRNIPILNAVDFLNNF